MTLSKALPVVENLASMDNPSSAEDDIDSSFIPASTKLASATGKPCRSERKTKKKPKSSSPKKSSSKRLSSSSLSSGVRPLSSAGAKLVGTNMDDELLVTEPVTRKRRSHVQDGKEQRREKSRSRSRERQEQALSQLHASGGGLIERDNDDDEDDDGNHHHHHNHVHNRDHHHINHHSDHRHDNHIHLHNHSHSDHKKKKRHSVKSSRVASIEVDDNNVDALVSSTTSLTLSGGHSSGNIIGPPGGRVGFDGSISRHSPSPPPSDGESFSDDVEEEDIDEYDENLAASANLSDLEEGRMTTNIKHKKKKEKERDSSTSDLKTKSKKKKKHKKRSELNSTEKGESKEVKGKKSGKKKKKHSKVKKQDDNGGDDEDPEGLMVEGKNSGRICYCLPPYCTRWTILASTVFFLVVAAAVAVPCYFFLWPNDDNAAPADNFPRIGDVSPETVLSEIPVTICNDWVPGSMSSSGECTNEITLEHGGLLCNLAAKSMLNTTVIADLALINAGTCRSDLSPPRVTAAEILDAIDADQIVVLDIAGADLEKLIFQAAEVSFGGLGGPERYPYASGMRWHMEANLPAYERVKMIEINRRLEGEWVPIDPGRFYRVATTKFLSQGGLEYLAFGKVLDEWKQEFEFQTIDTFYNFISTQPSSWWDLPQSEYSTQYFVAEDEVTEIAAVPARICSANVPGQPNSESCSASDVANGSGVCNLLAWAIYDQAADYDFDFVLVTADACGDDIPDDEVFGLESVYSAVDGNSILVTMDVPGHIIKIMIENSVGTALSFRPVSYPYAAGLRFSVDSTQDVGSWVSNIEFFDRDSGWRAFDPSLTYTVLTLEDVAIARDDAFFAIANADTSSIRDVSQGTQDFFLSYAEDWKELQTPPPEKASTQLFIA